MNNFNKALEIILLHECPYGNRDKCLVNDPFDRGDATNQGITEGAYHDWLRKNGEEKRSVKYITNEEVDAIYKEDYWIPGCCSNLPWPVALVHFDACVNHGVYRACKLLQAAAGVNQDGIIGPITLKAIHNSIPNIIAFSYLLERLQFYRNIVKNDFTQTKFFVGSWTYRLCSLYKELLHR